MSVTGNDLHEEVSLAIAEWWHWCFGEYHCESVCQAIFGGESDFPESLTIYCWGKFPYLLLQEHFCVILDLREVSYSSIVHQSMSTCFFSSIARQVNKTLYQKSSLFGLSQPKCANNCHSENLIFLCNEK